jgi:hypothetical protein
LGTAVQLRRNLPGLLHASVRTSAFPPPRHKNSGVNQRPQRPRRPQGRKPLRFFRSRERPRAVHAASGAGA